MSAVPVCRHIFANNMHALDASLYLAISTIGRRRSGQGSFFNEQRRDDA
jgi:hypothetical protein